MSMQAIKTYKRRTKDSLKRKKFRNVYLYQTFQPNMDNLYYQYIWDLKMTLKTYIRHPFQVAAKEC